MRDGLRTQNPEAVMASRDYAADSPTGPCCCGRLKWCDEPVIYNDKMHEPLSDPEAFCGPVYRHTIRDQQQEIERLRAALKIALGYLGHAMPAAAYDIVRAALEEGKT